MSDSAVMAQLIDNRGFTAAMEKWNPTGVWLWQSDAGRLWVHKSYGSLWYCPGLDAWGSEPAAEGVWYEVADGDYRPGETPRENVHPVMVYGHDYEALIDRVRGKAKRGSYQEEFEWAR